MRPPRALAAGPDDLVTYSGSFWRIHRTRGRHRRLWDDLRAFGPVATMRWDPHPPPPALQPDWAVSYASTDVATAFAEAFQARRAITVSSTQALAGWMPSRPLRLLDLTGRWLLHNGASASLVGGRKDRCRAWSHEIRRTWHELDGLLAPSTWTAQPAVVLFAPSLTAFPDDPVLARPLDSPALASTLEYVAKVLRWPIR